jgi:hypothetical protein
MLVKVIVIPWNVMGCEKTPYEANAKNLLHSSAHSARQASMNWEECKKILRDARPHDVCHLRIAKNVVVT